MKNLKKSKNEKKIAFVLDKKNKEKERALKLKSLRNTKYNWSF